MKNYTCLLLMSFFFYLSNAQSEKEEIYTCLQHYIQGTSYNNIGRIAAAFYSDANLYLSGKDNALRVVPSKKYISWFDNDARKGKFNGRIGNIISIDQTNDIATAKVEILIPAKNIRFTDLFLLKKLDGQWKIMSKSATKENSNKQGDRILFIVSNADHYGTSDLYTGNSFSEIVNAYEVFASEGYSIDFVSPDGGPIPVSYINTSIPMYKKYLYNSDFMYALGHTKKPIEIEASNYKAVYYVGGGSAMYGVPTNKEIQKISMHVYEEQGGIISSVCHGTAGIAYLKTKDGKYLVSGKRVNGYPDDYERKDAPYFKEFPFLIKKTIENHGGIFKFSKRNTPHIEVDQRLVTGQNAQSSTAVAKKITELLKKS
ncbi:nuclear transport factor 2 family protein [Aquimarina hainanensis]|uniref:Nuclear transport factor 2 family protein n=1 Tax=Aquimarina hainanensis TaxID=1578017 RepID=A0ABW5NAM6_9FLAO